MPLPNFIILTPLGPTKTETWETFNDHIGALKDVPQEKIVCIDDGFTYDVSFDNWTVLKQDKFTSKKEKSNRKIEFAREKLRKYFLDHEQKWAFWIDSDVFVPPHFSTKILKIAEKENAACVVNGYPKPYLGKGGNWHGGGCMLTHEDVCKYSSFEQIEILGHQYCEDYSFLSTLRGLKGNFDHFDIKPIIGGDFVDVQHKQRKLP